MPAKQEFKSGFFIMLGVIAALAVVAFVAGMTTGKQGG